MHFSVVSGRFAHGCGLRSFGSDRAPSEICTYRCFSNTGWNIKGRVLGVWNSTASGGNDIINGSSIPDQPIKDHLILGVSELLKIITVYNHVSIWRCLKFQL